VKLSKGVIVFVVILQAVLFLTHFFLYETWTFSSANARIPGPLWIKLVLGVLSATFIPASLLAFRYTNAFVRVVYRIAAVWAGLLSFLFIASVCSWMVLAVGLLAGLHPNFHRSVEALFAVALATGLYGVFNASWTRVTRTTVRLANLPDAWRGRKAALISDLHLGHVRNAGFLRRMVAKILNESRTQFLLPAICMTARPSTPFKRRSH